MAFNITIVDLALSYVHSNLRLINIEIVNQSCNYCGTEPLKTRLLVIPYSIISITVENDSEIFVKVVLDADTELVYWVPLLNLIPSSILETNVISAGIVVPVTVESKFSGGYESFGIPRCATGNSELLALPIVKSLVVYKTWKPEMKTLMGSWDSTISPIQLMNKKTGSTKKKKSTF